MPDEVRSTARERQDFSRRRFLQYSAAGISTAIMAACAPATTGPTTGEGDAAPAEGTAAEGPVQGGTLRLMGHQEVAGMSPNDQGPSVQEVIIYAIHNPLLMVNELLENEPMLAESYEVSEDGLTYTFNLHEGVPFHDGTTLTAEDVAYTYNFYRNPDNASTIIGDFFGIDTVEAQDDLTVVVNMAEVNAASLTSWALTPILHSAHHQEVGEDTYRTDPIGTGPFSLVEWVPAEVVELQAFEDHFRGRPHIDAIRQEVVPDPSVRAIALESGDSDCAIWPLLVEDSLRLADDPNFQAKVSASGSVKHFPLNNQKLQLSDKRVRQAMLHALDRQRIIDELWAGAATVAHTNLSPKFAFYSLSDSDDIKQYDYNVEAANALLDEAGWTMGDDGVRVNADGEPLTFTCTTITGDTARRPIAELAQQLLAEVGVDMQLAEAPISSILDGLREGTMDASLYNWTYGSTDPDPYGTLHSEGGSNWNNLQNEELDALIEEGLQIVIPEERQPIYHDIQRIVAEEVPMLYLQWDEWYTIFTGRVMGLPEEVRDGFTLFFTRMHEWWIDPNA